MLLIALVKSRNKYKEERERHAGALSIQAGTQLPMWK